VGVKSVHRRTKLKLARAGQGTLQTAESDSVVDTESRARPAEVKRGSPDRGCEPKRCDFGDRLPHAARRTRESIISERDPSHHPLRLWIAHVAAATFMAAPCYPRDPLHSTSDENPFAYASGLPCATESGIRAPDNRTHGPCNGDRSNARSQTAQRPGTRPRTCRQDMAQPTPGRQRSLAR
jgi:hypothetical protein